jgi:hypothetical protein
VTDDDTLARVVYVRSMELGWGPMDRRTCCTCSSTDAVIVFDEAIARSSEIEERIRSCTSCR